MALPQLRRKQVKVPADVPPEGRETYIDNFLAATKGTGRLTLLMGDQVTEGLERIDTRTGEVILSLMEPTHLFRLANTAIVGMLALPFGTVARYGLDYKKVNYLIMLNARSGLPGTSGQLNNQLWSVEQVLDLIDFSKLNLRGVGYTLTLGTEYEADMLQQAAQIAVEAHTAGLLVVFDIRTNDTKIGKDIPLRMTCGTGADMGADFIVVQRPDIEGEPTLERLREGVKVAGRTGVICFDPDGEPQVQLDHVHDHLNIVEAAGAAAGPKVYDRPMDEARRFCDAISAITVGGHDLEYALKVNEGTKQFKH